MGRERFQGLFAGCSALALAALLAVAGPVPQALGQAAVSGADPTAMPQTATPQEDYRLRGFRSARFGMDEEAVRAAIAADFGLVGEDVQVGDNTVERTRVLSVRVAELLPDSGVSQVSYILGYRSRALIQVGVLWSEATDPEITPAMLVANGDVLRAHFLAAGYQPDTVTTDLVLEDGVLLFRGADPDGHTAILLMQGRFTEAAAGRASLTPESLTLLYAQDPDSPDILSLEEGSF